MPILVPIATNHYAFESLDHAKNHLYLEAIPSKNQRYLAGLADCGARSSKISFGE
jgi:hypothetical protein